MVNIKKIIKDKNKRIFYVNSLIVFGSLIYSAIFNINIFIDILVVAGFLAVLYRFDKMYHFSIGTLLLMSLAILFHLFGVLGLYSTFLINGALGYDKIVHFTGGFAGAYTLIEASKESHKGVRYAIAILAVMGAGAIVETIEFLGWHYFGINNGGIFTQGDGLPITSSVLQKFDTYFDIMFNLCGACLGSLTAFTTDRLNKRKK